LTGPRPTVLLVDDEPRILSALKRTLRREGYTLRTAGSAAEAAELITRDGVDLVLSDHKMPGGNGLELLREVATQTPGTARILITGWPEAVAPAEIRAIGLHAVLPKPWDDGELRAALRSALAGRA